MESILRMYRPFKSVSEKELNQMKVLLKQKEKLNQSLELMDQLYDQQLMTCIPIGTGESI